MNLVLLFTLFLFFHLSTSASLLPIESSSVNVKNSGQEYSYTINANHGIAIEPLPHHEAPIIKIAPNLIKHDHLPVKEPEIKPLLQPQLKGAHFAMGYPLPVAAFPTYAYLPAQQYALPFPYGINYPYNLITNI